MALRLALRQVGGEGSVIGRPAIPQLRFTRAAFTIIGRGSDGQGAQHPHEDYGADRAGRAALAEEGEQLGEAGVVRGVDRRGPLEAKALAPERIDDVDLD